MEACHEKYTIGWGQLLILLLLCRILTYDIVLLIGEGIGFHTAYCLSNIDGIQAVMITPVILLNKTISSKSTTEIAFQNKVWGYSFNFVFCIFYCLWQTDLLQRFITVGFIRRRTDIYGLLFFL